MHFASEYEKTLDGTMFVVPFKNYQKCQKLKMASAALQTSVDEAVGTGAGDLFTVDTFWEDYKH